MRLQSLFTVTIRLWLDKRPMVELLAKMNCPSKAHWDSLGKPKISWAYWVRLFPFKSYKRDFRSQCLLLCYTQARNQPGSYVTPGSVHHLARLLTDVWTRNKVSITLYYRVLTPERAVLSVLSEAEILSIVAATHCNFLKIPSFK